MLSLLPFKNKGKLLHFHLFQKTIKSFVTFHFFPQHFRGTWCSPKMQKNALKIYWRISSKRWKLRFMALVDLFRFPEEFQTSLWCTAIFMAWEKTAQLFNICGEIVHRSHPRLAAAYIFTWKVLQQRSFVTYWKCHVSAFFPDFRSLRKTRQLAPPPHWSRLFNGLIHLKASLIHEESYYEMLLVTEAETPI